MKKYKFFLNFENEEKWLNRNPGILPQGYGN